MTISPSIRRHPERGSTDPAVIQAILAAAPMVHVGVVRDGWPVVLPMAHALDGDALVLHGSVAAGLFRDVRRGSPVCVTATLTDGLVLARSALNHSMNYRCAVVYGRAVPAADPLAALRAVVEHNLPGRWAEVRPPTEAELAETGVWTLDLADAATQASAKVRTGGPKDSPEDAALPVWAGVLPSLTGYGAPEPAADLAATAPAAPAPRTRR